MTPSAPTVPLRRLRPVRPHATAAVVLIGVTTVAGAVASFAEDAHRPEALLWLSVVHGVAGIGFLTWLFRARANAYAISPGVLHTYAAVFMVAGWILPVVNLFVPKGIIDDIWATSQPGGLPRGSDLLRVRRSGLIWAWWLTLLVAGGLGLSGLYADLGDRRTAFLVAALALWVASGVLAVIVVLKITKTQESARASGAPRPWQHLGQVALGVGDLDEAVAFYVGTLGFDLLEDVAEGEERRVTVRPPGTRETAILLLCGEAPSGNMLLRTDDLARYRDRLAAAGVTFDGTVFRDPFGNRWDLRQGA
ncbi:DUF4328 domain-containing protein [Nonomuraea mangrovi]|uniref:DUF4328 domain-containing protein n=1 Tax=Nonomuraea mangrovi TaxID=2316207 RepID=A0ABW4T2V9_9ACTN